MVKTAIIGMFVCCVFFSTNSFSLAKIASEPDFYAAFKQEPTVVALCPAVNFQIGEQFINVIVKDALKDPFTLGSGSQSCQVKFESATVDFEPNWCEIKFGITVSFNVWGITQSVYIPYSKQMSANKFRFEIDTRKIYLALNEYNEFLNYLNSSFASLPDFVKSNLSSYFNRYYVYPKKLAVQFADKLSQVQNAQVMDDLPFYWENRKTALTTAFDNDFARFTISVFLEKEKPIVEIWQRRNSSNQFEIRVVSNFLAEVKANTTSFTNYRFDNSRKSRYFASFTTQTSKATNVDIVVRNQHFKFSKSKCSINPATSYWSIVAKNY